MLRNHLISPSSFPLIKSHANPIWEYLHLLTKLRVVKQLSSELFMKVTEIKFHKNVEDALEADEKVIHALQTTLPNKIQA
uniref:Uncharacterized protein n=1 Tax=Virgibacillus oceani TaxID=1479511 RepID=A0A917M3U7_9BACI|nr:hypothetical protein GCM10011398_21130 [Virgibacillus oceani]